MLEAGDTNETSLLPLRRLIGWLEELTLNFLHPNIWAGTGPSKLSTLSHDFRYLVLENSSILNVERVLCLEFVLRESVMML